MVLGPALHLYTMAPDGSNVQALKSELDSLDERLPRWSPDSKVLAVVGSVKEELESWLYTVNADGSGWLRLTDAVSGPSWSPDGTQLAFAKPDGDDVALYTIAVDGTDARRVATVDGWRLRTAFRVSRSVDDELDPAWAQIGTVAWSPDGRHILYSCDPAICVVDLDGRLVGQAPLAPRPDEGPLQAAWSPDGSRIAIADSYVQNGARDIRVGAPVVYTVAPDGSDAQVLARMGLEGKPVAELSVHEDVAASQAACAAGSVVHAPAENPGLVRDCEVLIGLRDALFGDSLLNWGAGTPIAQWSGVTVAGSPPRVTGLLLEFALPGPFPAGLSALTHLQVLELDQLTGPIPAELGQMVELKRLGIGGSRLTGGIPTELGNLAQLEWLSVSGGQLTGGIPPETG